MNLDSDEIAAAVVMPPTAVPVAEVSKVSEAPVAAQVPTPAEASVISSGAAAAANEIDRVLTLEEQREVAFKVVFFFISLILASFLTLYVYHRASQSRKGKDSRDRTTL